jgi:hypothetical protein
MKYGHKFKHIIIAIPPHYPQQIFEIYNENITKPCDLCKEIDDKYDNIENEILMKKKLQEKIQQTQQIPNNEIINNEVINSEVNNDDKIKYQMFLKMMKMMETNNQN